ncbi:hypothetical protein M758_UG121000 [Ceratodon purpureus]|nr:hypothetical protein M758_UG121000 [Ceratodon purpureus]
MFLSLVSKSTVVSSCEDGERIPLGSQASETNESTFSHGCVSGEENVPSNCLLCRTKQHAVRLKACGHDTFYFGCVNGLKICPTCKEPIVGGEAIRTARSSHLVSDKTGGLERNAAATSIGTEEFGSKGATVPTDVREDLRMDIEEGKDYSDEEDNINAGLVHYCDDVTFSKGGVRSRSLELPEQENEPVHLCTEEDPITGATSRTELSTPPSSSDPIKEDKELSTVVKKKPITKQKDNNMNHTQIVKRTMSEILGIGCEEEPPENGPRRPRTNVSKKQISDIYVTQAGLRLSQNATARQTVSAKFRDM